MFAATYDCGQGKSLTTYQGKSLTTYQGKSLTTYQGKSLTTYQGKSLTTYLTTYSRCGNLLSFTEGLRKLPGCKRDGNSTGYLKVKLKGDGLRAVYRLERTEKTMLVVVVSTRDDNTVQGSGQANTETLEMIA